MEVKNDEQILYNVADQTKILHIGKNKIYELIKAGIIPALNIGGLKVRRQAVTKFLEEYEGFDLSDVKNIKKLEIDMF
mgnify:CR=1 FL=1